MSTLSMWKFRTSLSATVLAVASLSSAFHAQAQTAEARVNVPFAFEYGTRHFNAGLYTIHMHTTPVMSIQGQSAFGFTIVQPEIDSQPGEVSKVIFRRYGNRYFLREVWIAGENSHLQCVKAKAEKKAEKSELASYRTALSGVELALLQIPH